MIECSNKPAAYLEELKASGQIEGYTVIPIKLMENQQKEPWFEAVNPNVSLPSISGFQSLRIRRKSCPFEFWVFLELANPAALSLNLGPSYSYADSSQWLSVLQGRIPALLDNREGKKPIRVWES